jgi:hypothetical protein
MNEFLSEAKKLLRGEKPLWVTYWLYFAIPGIIFNYISVTYHVGFLSALFLAYLTAMLCAIWRSANAYQGNPIWKFLAKLSVASNIAAFISCVIAGCYI